MMQKEKNCQRVCGCSEDARTNMTELATSVYFLEQEVARLRRFSSHSVNRDSILERAVSSIARPK